MAYYRKNIMLSTKPEVHVHNVSQRHRKRTEHGYRQHAQQFGKDRACGSGDILADKQTHTDTQTYSSQYFKQNNKTLVVDRYCPVEYLQYRLFEPIL